MFSLPIIKSGVLMPCLRSVIVLSMIGMCAVPQVVSAKPLDRPVAQYPLQCDETFSCPASLLPRVGFWVEVFSRWDTNTAIFHDKENPQRVYSTLSRKQGCRRSRKGDSIDRERKRLKKTLRAAADRLTKGDALSSRQTRVFAAFQSTAFVDDQAAGKEMRAAAERVRCQSGNKDRMLEALKQFQLYRPTILDALEKQNLTPELQYLPFVESAFNPQALSHVGAAGLWQIMPSTGRTLGLTVNRIVDQRYDPTDATYAAAKYFRDSVDDLSETAFENGNTITPKDLNPFVITSYNYGVKGMERAIKQVGLDYERLLVEYKSPNFQTAVKNFYASFLAARHVAKNQLQFFGEVEPDFQDRIHSYNTVSLSRATSIKRLVKNLRVDKDVLKKLNPSLKRVVWRDKALVPKNFQLRLPYQDVGWSQEFIALNKLPKEVERPGYTYHKVRSGQTVCGIAERYRVSCRAVRKLNRVNSKGLIYIGQRLKIPSNSGGISVANSAASSSPSTSSTTTYRVRKGDTSCSVANRYDMKCAEFLAINGMTRSSLLRIGQRVTVSTENAWHIVRRGQTACGIAETYRVRCSALLDANRLRFNSTIMIGQRLRIPSRS